MGEILIKYGQRCKICDNENRKLSFDFVKNFIKSKGVKIFSKTYENTKTFIFVVII